MTQIPSPLLHSRWLALALAAALAGCSSDWTRDRDRAREANTAAPVSYRADIVALMHTYLNDPTGVREAFLSEPVLRTVDSAERQTVCLRYTARQSNGQYGSSKESVVVFRSGRLDHIIDAAKELCKDAKYQPFPELERMSR